MLRSDTPTPGGDGLGGAKSPSSTASGKASVVARRVCSGMTKIVTVAHRTSTASLAAASSDSARPETNFSFPDRRILCTAENAAHTLHNLLTLRGVLVRDPHVWSAYPTESIELYARQSDLVFPRIAGRCGMPTGSVEYPKSGSHTAITARRVTT
ncbi:hypothetical protein GCM10027089_59620 [Nocardia thraciensis]